MSYTPLHWACKNGHAYTAKLLLEHGADPLAHIQEGARPIHLACLEGHLVAAEVLLEHGVEVDVRDQNNQRTALHYACQHNHHTTVGMLLEHGANVNAAMKEGDTPLHVASRCGCTEAVQVLLQHGAQADAVGKLGYTPLHYAARRDRLPAAKLLLEHGAPIDAQAQITYFRPGSTPFHLAFLRQSTLLITLLLSRGANPLLPKPDRKAVPCSQTQPDTTGLTQVTTPITQNVYPGCMPPTVLRFRGSHTNCVFNQKMRLG
eukprot:TRINITY_DN12096_c0_g8_i4.p2 TRINITY_DN12096_c0_g8~~TRINITY_DN12096_c0_g8_i4.p2  ORF type:complete len:261 (+),score=12.47 TRINITY_DN12096_c0_g8_i4:2897-3679(+)